MPADVSVPLLDLKLQYGPIREEILRAITRVADSQQFILGPEVEAFEREAAAELEVRMPSPSPRAPTRSSPRSWPSASAQTPK